MSRLLQISDLLVINPALVESIASYDDDDQDVVSGCLITMRSGKTHTVKSPSFDKVIEHLEVAGEVV